MIDIPVCYRIRFSDADLKAKKLLWEILVRNFLQKYVKSTDTVLDIGAGYCEFINTVIARKKYALDPNPQIKNYAGPGVNLIIKNLNDIPKSLYKSMDIIFLSNVLEHMETKDLMLRTLDVIRKLLKPSGRLLIIQPVIDLTGHKYWDFIDHHIAITRRSLIEALAVTGFEVTEFDPRFLPYTTKSGLIKSPLLLKIYLQLPWFLRPFAGQVFVVCHPVAKSSS